MTSVVLCGMWKFSDCLRVFTVRQLARKSTAVCRRWLYRMYSSIIHEVTDWSTIKIWVTQYMHKNYATGQINIFPTKRMNDNIKTIAHIVQCFWYLPCPNDELHHISIFSIYAKAFLPCGIRGKTKKAWIFDGTKKYLNVTNTSL